MRVLGILLGGLIGAFAGFLVGCAGVVSWGGPRFHAQGPPSGGLEAAMAIIYGGVVSLAGAVYGAGAGGIIWWMIAAGKRWYVPVASLGVALAPPLVLAVWIYV